MTHVAAPGRAGSRRTTVLPTTELGRVACWLSLGFLGWLALNRALIGTQATLGGLPVIPRSLLSWVGLACGLAASIVALLAIVRERERGLLVIGALVPGVLVLAFLLGGLIAPS